MSQPPGCDQKQYEFVAHHCGTNLEDMGVAKIDVSYAQLQKKIAKPRTTGRAQNKLHDVQNDTTFYSSTLTRVGIKGRFANK